MPAVHVGSWQGVSVRRTAPLKGQVLRRVVKWRGPGYDGQDYEATLDINEASVTTSQVAGLPDIHKPVLDIDLPVKVVPSTTKGHFHLYIDKEMSWKKYLKLLDVLVEVGIIEDGYAGASEQRGFTAVRLPWVKKEEGQ